MLLLTRLNKCGDGWYCLIFKIINSVFTGAGVPAGSPVPFNSAGLCPNLVIQMFNCAKSTFIRVIINATGMEILVGFGIVFF